jgi:ribosomal protein S18 acetylase RimI-like enzyme
MTTSPLTPIGEDGRARAIATLVSAFTDDPVERWLYPETSQYLAHFPGFVDALGGRAIDAHTAWTLDDFSAVALWLPPDVSPDGHRMLDLLTTSVATAKHEELFDVIEQLDAGHPAHAHWYLAWLGVDPASQGHGLGAQLLAATLGLVDAEHLPAYLETPNPRTVGFYERHGFTVTGQAQAGTAPPLVLMSRTAR